MIRYSDQLVEAAVLVRSLEDEAENGSEGLQVISENLGSRMLESISSISVELLEAIQKGQDRHRENTCSSEE